MSKLGKFLVLSSIFLLGALVATGVVWYLLVIAPLRDQAAPNAGSTIPADTSTEITDTVSDAAPANTVVSDTGALPVITEPITIPLSSLTEAQQAVARTLGVADGEAIVITPEAQMCAEAKLGARRLGEIIAGDTPSIGEGFTLVNCL